MARPFAVTMVLSAVDRASGTVRGVTRNLRSIRAQASVTARTLGLPGVARRLAAVRGSILATRRAAIRLGASIRPMLAPIGAVAIGGLAAFAGSIVRVASDVEESTSKFKAVFKEQSDAAFAWAADQAKAVNRSRFDLENYMATFQDTFVPFGFARKEAAQLSQVMTELAVDLASFNNESEPEAAAKLASALVGNTEAVRSYGVVITQQRLNQELMNLGIAGGVAKATELQKVQARVNLIMRDTTDAQGDAAKTADGFANRYKGLLAVIKDVAATAGGRVLPVFNQLVKFTTDFIQANKELITQKIVEIVRGFAAAVTSVNWVAVGQGVMGFVAGVREAVSWVGGWTNALILLVGILHADAIIAVAGLAINMAKLGFTTGLVIIKMVALGAVMVGKMVLSFFTAMQFGVGVMKALNIAMASNPIGLLITALVGGAALIIQFWTPIKKFFASLNIFEPIRQQVAALIGILPDFLQKKLGFSADIKTAAGKPPVQASNGGGGLSLPSVPKLPGAGGITPPPSITSQVAAAMTLLVRFENAPVGTRLSRSGALPGIDVQTQLDVGHGLVASGG